MLALPLLSVARTCTVYGPEYSNISLHDLRAKPFESKSIFRIRLVSCDHELLISQWL